MFRFSSFVTALLTASLFLPIVASAQVPAAPTLQASVSGTTVSASWSTVPGAGAYRVEAGLTPSVMLAGYEVGPLTSFTLPQVPSGTYYLRVRARNLSGASEPSNVVGVTVSTAVAPPAAPSNVSASVAGNAVTISAQLPPGPLSGLLMGVGLTPNSLAGVLPLNVAAQNTIPNVPAGVYYARLVALNAGGQSPASNLVQIVVNPGACSAPAAPLLTAQVAGSTVLLTWTSVAGAAAYRLDVSATPGGAPFISQALSAATTSISNPFAPAGTYYARVTAGNSCGQSATSAEVTVNVAGNPGGYRTPNPNGPTPPNYLPLPNRGAVVAEMARQYPNEFRNSCVEHGGNNTFLYRLVQRLRQEDTRWGLNWKRARVGDMSQDVINYNYGSDADEGTYNTYVIDVIGAHCGNGNPTPTWNDVTVMFSTGARWTLQPYLAAGYR